MTNLPQKQHQKWANYLRLSPVPISCITLVTQCHLKTLSQTSRKYFTEPRRLSHPTRPVSPCLEPPFQIITPMTTRRTKCSLFPSSASARHARLVFPRPTIPSHQRDSTSSSSSTPVAIDCETLISTSSIGLKSRSKPSTQIRRSSTSTKIVVLRQELKLKNLQLSKVCR